MPKEIGDLLSAPFTPLTEDGELNLDFLPTYADYLVKTNFEGVFLNGSLAEGLSCTLEERKKLAKGWIDAINNRLSVIVHVGSNCLKDSQELARHAEENGADAIAAFSPSYYKPENEDVLLSWMKELASAAPNTPFYYYDINFCTGVYINCRRFMEKAVTQIPTLKGMKHSSLEMTCLFNCTLIPDSTLHILQGTDDQYLSCLTLGISGVVANSALGNTFYNMKAAFLRDDMDTARKLQELSQKLTNVKVRHGGGINVAKCLFKLLTGLDIGPVRLPLRQLTADQLTALRKDVETEGLLEFATGNGEEE